MFLFVQVKTAAKDLDRLKPGWASRINTERLDMGSVQQCILGQLYGTFGQGTVKVSVDRAYTRPFLYDAAAKWWKREIRKRLKHRLLTEG